MTFDRPIYGLSPGSQLAAEVVFGLGALLALVYCAWLARKEGKIWPLMVWISGAVMTLWEPMQNIVTHVSYPEIGQHTAFEIYDLKMPVYLVLLYVTYFGITVPWLMKKIEEGVTVKWLMKMYFGLVMFAAAFEPIPVHVMDWYRYYGENQPLKFFGIPIWWFFVNAMVIIGVAMIFAVVRKYVLTADWQSVVFIPAGLLVCGGLHHSAGIPVYTAIGSEWTSAATIPLSLVTCGLAIAWVYLLARLVASPSTATPAPSATDAADRTDGPVRA
ncbi:MULTISPECIES: hypothetical protein [Rhodococcus]|uniref:Carotenoid biosynthesis protein n=1 Tax=Rhodococcus opacus TaxID=37919 RepID=A0AAX3Y5X6_RHOOP|nr:MULTISPECIES: hypothetical protein [Rhodococcus]NHU41770.1 hypothetical protein [Rhodococcus sp. A14]MCZ4586324.1 hypothetical protein [Rhodococcus opacus]MDI9940482.1 hypothetical protein [Rhodococcus sp. IEGM 1351]UZG53002.1 hypothetical protein ONE62_23110 [Rhodococcus opacus]WLF44777.1 hypothetical protein Q5707_22940 [Rhodococcus opacus]